MHGGNREKSTSRKAETIKGASTKVISASSQSWVECTPRLSEETSQRKDTVSVGISEMGNRINLKFMFTLPGTPAPRADRLSARRRVFVPVYTSASLVEVLCPYGHELRHGGRGEKIRCLCQIPRVGVRRLNLKVSSKRYPRSQRSRRCLIGQRVRREPLNACWLDPLKLSWALVGWSESGR